MNTTTPAIQNLARRLIAAEAVHAPAAGSVGAEVRVCNKLRMPLAKLAGVEGFRSLMARAKALAAAEVPWLSSLQVRTDGSLEEVDAASSQQSALQGEEARVAIVAQLLGLLVTFIGEPLTLHLVRDAWSDDPVTGMDAGTEEKS
jgi:hypothetical protein